MRTDDYAAMVGMSPEERQQYMAMKLREEEMQSKGGGGPSPAMAMKFMPQSAGAGGGASGGASAGGSAGGSGGMAAAAWPAALAAVIIGNETYQNKKGNRPEKFSDHMTELATGEVLERDVEKYLGDSKVAKHLGRMGNPKGLMKNMKQGLKPWEWF